MADGYEPTSAVSPQAQASIAQFGAPNAVTSQQNLGFAELQQRKNEAQQQAQERLYERQQRASEFGQTMGMQQQGMGLQRESLNLERQRATNEMERFQLGQSHEEKMAKDNQNFQMGMMREQQRIADNRKILELQFAQSTGIEREKLAGELLGVRKQASDISGKMTAHKLMQDRSLDEIKNIKEHVLDTATQLEEIRKDGRDHGSQAAKFAVDKFYGHLIDDSNDSLKEFKANEIANGGWLAGTTLSGQAPEDLVGLGMLRQNENEVKRFGMMHQLSEGLHLNFDSAPGAMYDVDQNKVNGKADMMFAGNLANSIAEASAGTIKASDIGVLIEQLKNGSDLSPLEISEKLQASGVSPDVMHSALVHMADAFDGHDQGAFNAMNLRAKKSKIMMDNGGRESVQTKSLDAAEMFSRRVASLAREMASKIPETDIEGIRNAITYMDRALQGRQPGGISRSELAKLIPAMGGKGSKYSNELKDYIQNSRQLSELEKYQQENKTTDPFRYMDEQYRQYQGLLPEQQLRESLLQSQMENVASNPRSLEALINAYRSLGQGGNQ